MSIAIRSLIAQEIRDDNPLFLVHDYPVNAPENLARGKVWVNVYRETLTNAPQAAALSESLRIVVITPMKDTAAAEEALELALDAVMRTLTRTRNVNWTTAERATFNDSYIGYEISITVSTENAYKS
ncbi:hypothetical protein PSET11_03036 [Arthrobacter ulcerisalmonis]|uniref:Uncharacterized protein n=1 Tax=Arthrobacter ulcerisalmonis TaxID=2483813 RepID=A0A3P5XN18_9MICC|nr:hypothetical protein [Arthrobacter ulcerisalmonis]VDC32271.1 hypothetical protein PSET11_03036 [Arthrobacter ulcerisalmonis]